MALSVFIAATLAAYELSGQAVRFATVLRMHSAFVLTHFWQFFYFPGHGPWYGGAVWSNVFVIAVLGPLGWFWSRTKFWPFKPLHKALTHLHLKMDSLHEKHDDHATKLDRLEVSIAELHAKHDALYARLDVTHPRTRREDPRDIGLKAKPQGSLFEAPPESTSK